MACPSPCGTDRPTRETGRHPRVPPLALTASPHSTTLAARALRRASPLPRRLPAGLPAPLLAGVARPVRRVARADGRKPLLRRPSPRRGIFELRTAHPFVQILLLPIAQPSAPTRQGTAPLGPAWAAATAPGRPRVLLGVGGEMNRCPACGAGAAFLVGTPRDCHNLLSFVLPATAAWVRRVRLLPASRDRLQHAALYRGRSLLIPRTLLRPTQPSLNPRPAPRIQLRRSKGSLGPRRAHAARRRAPPPATHSSWRRSHQRLPLPLFLPPLQPLRVLFQRGSPSSSSSLS